MIAPFQDFPATRPAPRVTLKDIATASGVSTATVSLALRNSPRISDERKAFILEVCDRLGYVRDARLSELMSHLRKGGRGSVNGALGVLVTRPLDAERSYDAIHRELMVGIRRKAESEGYALNVFDVAKEGLRPQRLRQILDARGISAIVALPSDDHSSIRGFDFSGLAAIAIGSEDESLGLNRICPNYLKMMDQLMRETLAQGYRRVGVAPPLKRGLLRNRMINSSLDYHLYEMPEASRAPDYDGGLDDASAFQDWIRIHQPDLILGDRKTSATLEALGTQAPEEIGFAAFDTVGMPESVSGLSIPYQLIAEEAVRLLVSQSNDNVRGLPEIPETVVVDGRYRSSETTASRYQESMLLTAV